MSKEITGLEKTKNGKLLPIMEDFYTVQGEGAYMGQAAYFIRTGGCDVGCPWCDIKESWDALKHPFISVEKIINKISKQVKIAVITGGEPLMWQMAPLTKALQKINIRTHIETSGAYEITGNWDWFCLSPKKRKMPIKEAYKAADELKIIIRSKADFDFAENEANKVGKNCLLFLQVEWEKRAKMTPFIVRYVKQNPKWHISVQTHKYLDIP